MAKKKVAEAPLTPIKASISLEPAVHAAAVALAKKEKRSLSSWVAITVEEKLQRA